MGKIKLYMMLARFQVGGKKKQLNSFQLFEITYLFILYH